MSHQFARLFNLEKDKAQVLLTVDTVDDQYALVVRTEYEGVEMTTKLEYSGRDQAMVDFVFYTPEKAQRYFDSLKNTFDV